MLPTVSIWIRYKIYNKIYLLYYLYTDVFRYTKYYLNRMNSLPTLFKFRQSASLK